MLDIELLESVLALYPGFIHGSPVQHMPSLLLFYTFPCVFLFIFNVLYLLISNI